MSYIDVYFFSRNEYEYLKRRHVWELSLRLGTTCTCMLVEIYVTLKMIVLF